ncbi:pyrimidine dimer DNA glycosylase [Cutibacterium avidum]|uniref:Pyrimidine dimer DNA glycosylase n=1 Tax=Cutibacterium avidum ATCC 25577 TaxID=997355 RepID=G4CU39_9ACTN|nr:pyrimidine dimer DNA glycosylase/DNA-(apurinic or apyrimidinic site) lyase [Cutibacterium avidum 44067]EGY79280.1 pyrimidine dimer DNA glycosylase [Cutibacterium avidum ATCC 25577]ERF59295.1 pyrimidine dimer DNA glycosylase/DNA-(apurinic or apyrimidinic site) lyase [Cutibacterium avidum TM16]KXA67567.1 hypothetical protein HMPREF3223_01096 [Cutibacterium avidum]OIJ75763.1 pyrimidine dimer DNA glycosylase [Cutibacterium avidum]
MTSEQLDHEMEHLHAKVTARSPEWPPHLDAPRPRPLFVVVPGPVEVWERT